MKILNLLGRECKTLLLVVAFEVFDEFDGLGSDIHSKDILVESFIEALQHGVVLGILIGNGKILLDALHTLDTHILGNLNGICTPRSNHFATRAYKITFDTLSVNKSGSAVQPAQFFYILFCQEIFRSRSNDATLGGGEKVNHFCLSYSVNILNHRKLHKYIAPFYHFRVQI